MIDFALVCMTAFVIYNISYIIFHFMADLILHDYSVIVGYCMIILILQDIV